MVQAPYDPDELGPRRGKGTATSITLNRSLTRKLKAAVIASVGCDTRNCSTSNAPPGVCSVSAMYDVSGKVV